MTLVKRYFGGEYNEVFTAYLDIIVEYAKALEDENIPIIFRPFHENIGSWFWWVLRIMLKPKKFIPLYKRLYRKSGRT